VALPLESDTERERGLHVGNRSDAQAVPDALRAEVGLLHHGPVASKQRCVVPLHVGEKGKRFGLGLLRSHLTTYWLGGAGMAYLGGAACAGAAGNSATRIS
jgi:hypothetical protein